MALSRPEQLIKITLLLRTVPDEVEKHFCSTEPACMKFCKEVAEDGTVTRNKSKCALFSLPEEEVRKTIFGLDNIGRMLGHIKDE